MREQPNRMLEFLTAPPKPAGDACRSNRRRRSSARVELAWPEPSGWKQAKGRLRDIGRGGASLIAGEAPAEPRRARLRVIDGEGTPWIEAVVLGVEPLAPSRRRVRLKFEEPCPSFFLRLAVLGAVEAEGDVPECPKDWASWDAVASE